MYKLRQKKYINFKERQEWLTQYLAEQKKAANMIALLLKNFEENLNPLRWIERQLNTIPVTIAKNYGIKLVFRGENSYFEYGRSDELEIFGNQPVEEVKVIYLGAIYPYSIGDSLSEARSVGFKDLDDFNEWPRSGMIENYTQIDSIGYVVHLWCKFVKFGFQMGAMDIGTEEDWLTAEHYATILNLK